MNQQFTGNVHGELNRWINDVREGYINTDPKTVARVEAICQAMDEDNR